MTRFALALVCLAFAATADAAAARERILVFAAASVALPLQALADAYQNDNNVRIDISAAATSTLARQIARGAPANLFVSASIPWMDHLATRDRLVDNSRSQFLGNTLVMIAPRDAATPVALEPDAMTARLADGRLAVADPDHVPAGIYAREALINLGLWRGVSERLAAAPNVVAAMNFVARGETPLGIVYATDALASDKVRVVARFPIETHSPVVYELALVRGHASPAARAFFAYLTGDAARTAFEAAGFVFQPTGAVPR